MMSERTRMRSLLLIPLLVGVTLLGARGQTLEDIEYLSAADNTRQRAMFFDPKPKEAVPLVVALHTWSGDYKQQHHKPIREWCMKNGWPTFIPTFVDRPSGRRPRDRSWW